ncbi:EF-hand domain-containing protein [Sandaracinobacter neustonicus]|uniref:EF-hand domain-containing protein n=1 Tax=Sandaracinobacter neustonicus TaxID=1715348 RepID=UPI0015E36238|nr:EF-hand domain-containing protein [Sandaracinobacter neustonicus]
MIQRPTCLLLLTLLAGTPAAAQSPGGAPPPPGTAPRSPQAPQGPTPPQQGRVQFIAPSGEPFRAEPGQPYPVAAWFAAADSNHDGRLTSAEFLADANRYFDLLDSNKNGQIDAAEVDAYEAGVLAPLNQRRGGNPGGGAPGGSAPGGGPGGDQGTKAPPAGAGPMGRKSRPRAEMPSGAGMYGLINSPHPVKAADRDMNSRVTREEWTRTLSDRFTMLDTEQRGYLTLETLPQTPAQLRMGDSSAKPKGHPPEPR